MNAPESNSRTSERAGGLARAAQDVLSHGLTLEQEDEAAQMLRAMGVESPTGADALVLGQYLKAIRGDTSAAKFVRDAALDEPAEPETGMETDLTRLSDAELYALLRVGEP